MSQIDLNNPDVSSALTTFLETLPYDGPWGSFTCREIDALVALLKVTGQDETALEILQTHALADDEGDKHYQLYGPARS